MLISYEAQNGIIYPVATFQALKNALEWLELHKAELMENWSRATKGEPLKSIEPLE